MDAWHFRASVSKCKVQNMEQLHAECDWAQHNLKHRMLQKTYRHMHSTGTVGPASGSQYTSMDAAHWSSKQRARQDMHTEVARTDEALSPSFLTCTSPHRCSHWRGQSMWQVTLTHVKQGFRKATIQTIASTFLARGSPYCSSYWICSSVSGVRPCCSHWGGTYTDCSCTCPYMCLQLVDMFWINEWRKCANKSCKYLRHNVQHI